MATSNTYTHDSIIGRYVAQCVQAKHPLDTTQIDLLETTINAVFGITRLPELSPDVFKPMDTRRITGRLQTIIAEYRETCLGVTDDLPLSDAEAWSVFSLTASEISDTTFPTFKRKHNLPSKYGQDSYHYLHRYFIDRGYIPPKTKLPMPKS